MDARNVNEGPLHARKIDASSRGCNESGWNFDRRLHALPGPSVKFHQLFVHVIVLLRQFCSLLVCRRQLFLCLLDLLSTYRMFLGLSINFPSDQKIFRQLLSTFRACAGPPTNFLYGRVTVHQHSVSPRDSLSTAVNISSIRKIFLKFSICLPDTSSTSVNFLSIHRTFHLLSARPQNLNQNLLAFHVSAGTSKSSVRLLDLLSTSVIFPCRHATFRQLSVHQRDIPSTSVNLLCIQGIVC